MANGPSRVDAGCGWTTLRSSTALRTGLWSRFPPHRGAGPP